MSQERDIVQELSASSGECGLDELDDGFEMAMIPLFMLQNRGNVSLSVSLSGPHSIYAVGPSASTPCLSFPRHGRTST